MLPKLIVHADWSVNSQKRWMCSAYLDGNIYRVSTPVPVHNPNTLVFSSVRQSKDGGVVLGFDFPIGVPKSYASLAGFTRFLDALPDFGTGQWRDFYKIAEQPDQISIYRPFYPKPTVNVQRTQLVQGLKVNSFDDLLRRCEFGNGHRNNACSLFWTLGGNQVGRAAMSGWREMLLPAMKVLQNDLAVWPFHGELQSLISTKKAVVVETYPGDACVQLGLGAPGRGWGSYHIAAKSAILVETLSKTFVML